MVYLTCTRFNTETFKQNETWRKTNKHVGCIYGTPVRMKDDIFVNAAVIVLEMQNDINKIVGIGLIRNSIEKDKRYHIYDWGNYNRYAYKGDYRISREELRAHEEKVLAILDMLCFKGSRHLKRGSGITSLPSWIVTNSHIDFTAEIQEMFRERFGVSR